MSKLEEIYRAQYIYGLDFEPVYWAKEHCCTAFLHNSFVALLFNISDN